jgi:MSHA biogenesis protein MshO
MSRAQNGVTLIELIVVIILTAILAAIMSNFVVPFFSYADARRRAEMTDIADTALRRMGRDLRLALPNSVRTDGTKLEFLLVRAGGRYRRDAAASSASGCDNGAGTDPTKDVLSFGANDQCFKSIGNMANAAGVLNTDFLVVYNLQPGTDQADAYQTNNATGGNKALVTSVTAQTDQDLVVFASRTFTYESPAQRFQIIEGPVMYVCDTGNQQLVRYSGYGIQSGTAPGTPSGTPAVVASNVTSCQFTYDPNTVAQSNGLVTLRLQLSSTDLKGSTETVSLYYEVHVSNVP